MELIPQKSGHRRLRSSPNVEPSISTTTSSDSSEFDLTATKKLVSLPCVPAHRSDSARTSRRHSRRRANTKETRSNSTQRSKEKKRRKKRETITKQVDAVSQLSKEEFEALMDQFKFMLGDSKDGKLSREQFIKSLGLLGESKFGEQLFDLFDDNKDGSLAFPEFLHVMAIFLRGSTKQKFSLAFCLCDRNCNRKLIEEDIFEIINTMYNILSNLGITTTKQPEQVAKSIFSELDQGKNGTVTKSQYKSVASKNPLLLQGIGIFNPEKIQNFPVSAVFPSQGLAITPGHQNWPLVLNIMIGLRLSINTSEADSTVNYILPKHFTEKQTLKLASKFSGEVNLLNYLADHVGEGIVEDEFITYTPFVFKHARKVEGIEEEHYLLSVGPEQFLGNILCGNLASMRGSVSAGKSGSFFFTSHDGRYLIKTIHFREINSFIKIIPEYFEHVSKYRNSLLNRIFGCHRIGSIPFVVLENVFATVFPIHEIYDLKGSEHGRTSNGKGVMKDLDFKRKLHLSQEMKDLLLEQIDIDSKKLEEMQLIDYSLLIGIHKIDEDVPLPKGASSVTLPRYNNNAFANYHGGILSSDKKEIYFLGIIDYLTIYGRRKTAETIVRCTFLNQERGKISTVPPNMYGERFRTFIRTNVVA